MLATVANTDPPGLGSGQCSCLQSLSRSDVRRYHAVAVQEESYGILRVVITEAGPAPAPKGEPATAISAPALALMVNAETLWEPKFAT